MKLTDLKDLRVIKKDLSPEPEDKPQQNQPRKRSVELRSKEEEHARNEGLVMGQKVRMMDTNDTATITGHILKESKRSVTAMQSLSASAYHFLMKESPEPGTKEAYKLFLACGGVMFKTVAAIELCRLGYKFENVNLS